MDSTEHSNNSMEEPLLKQLAVKKVDLPNRHHRRNKSAEIILKEERKKELKRNESENSLPNEVGMDGKPGFDRKKLSDARGVNLKEIIIPQRTQYPLPLDAPTPIQKPRTFRDKHTPPLTSSPVGNVLYHLGAQSSTGKPGAAMETIDIRVFFSDGQGMEFSIEGGKLAEADYLLRLAAHQRGFGEDLATETFSLWMVSPLLEVQLKPHHRPYEVRCHWAHLLKRFTDCSDDQCHDDDPALVMKRNVSLENSREEQLCEYPVICEILFEDARSEFLSGRYAVDCRTAAQMAGLSMCSVFGQWNSSITMDIVRKELDDHLPARHIANVRGPLVFGRALSGTREMEDILVKEWKAAGSKHEARRRFLRKAAELPSYGSAFFTGHIERPSTSFKDIKRWFHSSNEDIKVIVGVNRGCVTVIDPSKGELLLVQPIEDCSWRRVDPDQTLIKEGAEPSLLLHFPEDPAESLNELTLKDKTNYPRAVGKLRGSESPPAHTKLLQIFGPQVVMIDALMTSMLNLKRNDVVEMASSPEASAYENNSFEPSSSSSSDGGRMNGAARIARQPSMTKGHRMCLATFDTHGNCLKAQGSLKKVLSVK